jgi:AcrR family transcriptional regulator
VTTKPHRIRGEYRKTSQRRETILDAAFEVFSRVGYLNASVTEIARDADLTLPGLSHHYPSKAALFSAVLERRDLEAQSILSGRSGVDLLLGLIAIARRDQEDRRATRLFAIISAEATDPSHPLHDYFRQRYATVLDHVTRTFEEAARAGHLCEGVDIVETARRYIALSDGLQLQALYDPASSEVTSLLKYLQELVTVDLGTS